MDFLTSLVLLNVNHPQNRLKKPRADQTKLAYMLILKTIHIKHNSNKLNHYLAPLDCEAELAGHFFTLRPRDQKQRHILTKGRAGDRSLAMETGHHKKKKNQENLAT